MANQIKYEKLQEQLKAELASGKFQPGDRFYTEQELVKKYGVSGITVARALNEMTQQGYFRRKRKLGTFVLESPEIPGMTGKIMTRPLFINRAVLENTDAVRSSHSWFLVEEIRRGIINSYPGAVKIIDMERIMEESENDPDLLAVLLPQQVEFYDEKYAGRKPVNSVEIVLPPSLGKPFNCIRPNYLAGVYEGMEHLIQRGHTRIAFLGHPGLRNRYAAYRIALETYGLPYLPELSLMIDEHVDDAETESMLIRKVLALPSPPSAICCGTDRLAISLMQALKKQGVKVPEEISVIGFDDIAAAGTLDTPLSTVHVPYYELGKAAVGLLLEKIKTGKDVPSATLMTHFVMRQSTAEYQK